MFAALGFGANDTPAPPLRLGRSDEPHIADGRLPLHSGPSPSPPPSPLPSPGLPDIAGFFGDIGRSAQAAFAPLRSLGQPLIPPPPPTASDLLHRDPFAASRQRQQQRQPAPSHIAFADDAPDAPDHSTSSPPSQPAKSGVARFDHRPPSAASSLPPQPSSDPTAPAHSFASPTRPTARQRPPKSKQPKRPPEQLVIVRPPPSKRDALSYNLQVQLVSRRTRERGNTASSQTSSRAAINVSMESLSSRTSTIPPDTGFGLEDDALGMRPSESGQSRLSSDPDAPSRRASVSSNRSRESVDTFSNNSGYGSSLSVNSASGTPSTSRSRVIPLYNLTFHSLLPSIVSDAGTDERVAKVTKRGHVELEGMAVLEPAELVMGANDIDTVLRSRPAARMPHSAPTHSASTPLQLVNEVSHTSDGSKDSSPPMTSPSISLNGVPAKVADAGDLSPHGHERLREKRKSSSVRPMSAQVSSPSPPVGVVARSQTAMGAMDAPPSKSGNKFLSGFKKLMAPRAPVRTLPTGGDVELKAPHTLPAPEGEEATARTSLNLDTAFSGTLLAGVLGDGVPMWPIERRARRASGYVWTVRRWLRRGAEPQPSPAIRPSSPPPPPTAQPLKLKPSQASIGSASVSASSERDGFAAIWTRFSTDRSDPAPSPATVPIRFEWTRDLSRTRRAREAEAARDARRATSATRLAQQRDPTSPQRRFAALPHSGEDGGAASVPASPAVRPAYKRGASLDVDRGRTESTAKRAPTLDGSPCRKSQAGQSSRSVGLDAEVWDGYESDPEDSETPWRLCLVLGSRVRVPLALLTPTPHHPRLVAHLTVPFPLPDLRASGLAPDRAGLSPEELKDVASTTALHLVVREGFGAMARTKKA